MTELKGILLNRDEVLALRGLRLSSSALKGLKRAGIDCQPAVSIDHQQGTQHYAIRGVESGGAVVQTGAYCGFVDAAGSPLPVLRRVETVGVNGPHAVVLSPTLVRVQMFRAGTTYELLLTCHTLVPVEGKGRPRLQNSVLFHGRHGRLEMELWGKDRQLRGAVAPAFYSRSGELIAAPERFRDPVLKATAGACCVGCRHNHLLGSGTPLTHWRETNVG